MQPMTVIQVSPAKAQGNTGGSATTSTVVHIPDGGSVPSIPHRPADVDLEVELRLVVPDGQAVPIPVGLRYNAGDPYAVRAVFRGEALEVEWVFARDLLSTGMSQPVGEGDVQVWPARDDGNDVVLISLSSPDGRAVLEADTGDLRGFLEQTAQVVPPGEEGRYTDIDAALSSLLADS